jgi:uncharacterized membrane protein
LPTSSPNWIVVLMKMFFLYLMGVLYILAGLNHFRAPGFYRPMMPPYLPAHDFLIAASGVAEIALGALLLWPPTRELAAWGIIALLVAVFPANIYMVQMRDTVFSSIPTWFLYLRLPLQGILVLWAYIYTR